MRGRVLDAVILGSNPLSGTDHYLADRARARNLELTPETRLRVIRSAFLAGASGFTFNADRSTYELISNLADDNFGTEIGLYPLLPNADLVPALLNSGTAGAISVLLEDLKWSSKARAVLSGGWSWITSNPMRAGTTYLDVEMARLRQIMPSRTKVRAVVLHELLSDAMLGLDLREALHAYVRHVLDKLECTPGFVTRNFPRFVNFCENAGIELSEILVMTPFNPLGYQMTPDRTSCEAALRQSDGRNVVGISLLAGGQVGFEDAMRYLRELGMLKSVAVGVSSASHATSTFSALREVLGRRA